MEQAAIRIQAHQDRKLSEHNQVALIVPPKTGKHRQELAGGITIMDKPLLLIRQKTKLPRKRPLLVCGIKLKGPQTDVKARNT